MLAGDSRRHLRGGESRRAALRRGAARLARRGSLSPEVDHLSAGDGRASRSSRNGAAKSRSSRTPCISWSPKIPCVRVEHHSSLNETVLYGMGDLHLRVMLQRMGDRYGVRCKTHVPSIPYRETITRPAPKATIVTRNRPAARDSSARCTCASSRSMRGQGFEFVDEVVGGAIPSQFIPAVEKGVRQMLTEGAVAGFPLQDLRVIVYDGKYHAVDSKEVAFVSAGRRAFLNGFREAGPIVLEPVVRVEVTSPSGVDRRHHRRPRDASRPRQRQSVAGRPAHAHQRARAAGRDHATTSRASSH